MKLFHKPFGHYLRQTRWGMGLLLAVAVVRFLMLPLFQVPYETGTGWVSLTVLLPVLMLVYAVVVARGGGNFPGHAGFITAISVPKRRIPILNWCKLFKISCL